MHGRVPVGEQFSVGAHTFVVSGPAEISLLAEPSAPLADPSPAAGSDRQPTPAAGGSTDDRWMIGPNRP